MRLFLAAILLSSLVAPAVADPSPDAHKMASDDCARARKAKKDCLLVFDSHEIDGSTPQATGTTVTALTDPKHPSLIRLRRDFIPEILKSGEDL